jgi:hypothetical protein
MIPARPTARLPRTARVFLEGVAPFAAAGLLFGLLYNTLFYPWTLVEYTEAGTIGVLLGGGVGIAEQHPAFRRWLQQRSFLEAIAVRTLAYSIATAVTLSLVLSVEPATLGECAYPQCIGRYIRGPLFVRDVAFTTVFVFVATFAAQLVFLVGTRNFGRLVVGRYRRPRELKAEFMFVDLRGSTSIAETLGHERYLLALPPTAAAQDAGAVVIGAGVGGTYYCIITRCSFAFRATG